MRLEKVKASGVILVAALSLAGLVSCSRAPDLVGVDNPETPVLSVQEASRQKLYIMTTRQVTETAAAFYSGQRAPGLGMASVVVSIPPNHVPGELERAKRMPPDPRTEFAVIEPTIYDNDRAFVSTVNRSLAQLPAGKRDILFFIHGYNNTISDSILRLAQFVEDTDFEGVPVLFSWASAAQPAKYVYDLNSALAARPKLLQAADILSNSNARGVDVFAHSMGSMLTMEAIVAAELKGSFNHGERLNSIMLAAPDIDIDVFRTQLSQIDERNRNLFILTSEDDSALRFSRRISGGVSRVGSANANELAELGVTVIDLSQIDDSKSGSHSKFAGSPEVVQLIGKGLNNASRFGASTRNPLGDFIADLPIQIVTN